ncbi:MAG: carboxypeptidase regulatory-like domain-containing protein, partial [Clostridia bacterium]|nr:carboxypeptidase regulatory-like domain-containing protein [Clostridia bacterium]
MSFDAGLYSYGSLGNYVWHDEDVDGIQDDGEAGIADITVTLYEKVGDDYIEAASTKTDADGYYLFDTLNPNDYQVKIKVPVGYKLSDTNEGSDDEKDSDFNPWDYSSETVFIESGEHDLSIDAGIYQLSQLGNYIWLDKNADGIQGDDEDGIENVKVKLLNAFGFEIASTSTDAEGFYLFDELEVGEYKIEVIPPAGFVASEKNVSDDTKDSDIDAETFKTDSITIASSNVSDLSLDAGLYQKAAVGDYVWEDMNSNGIQEATEPGIEGIQVTLFLPDDSTKVTKTDENGFYEFTDLVPGTYKVHFDMPSGYILSPTKAGADEALDSDANQDTRLTDEIILESNDVISTIDAGFYRPVRIGDYVWLDKNRDGIQDPSEKGIKGINVKLILSDDTTIETETDENGFYEFDNLTPGTYKVVFKAPERHRFTVLYAGSQEKDSNADTRSGMSDEI